MGDNEKYWNNNELKENRKFSVKIEFIKNFIEKPLLFENLASDELIQLDPYLLPGFQASSMPLNKNTFKRILDIEQIDCTQIDDKNYYLKILENDNFEEYNGLTFLNS